MQTNYFSIEANPRLAIVGAIFVFVAFGQDDTAAAAVYDDSFPVW